MRRLGRSKMDARVCATPVRAVALSVVGAAAVLVVACDSTTGGTPTTSQASGPAFDPCTISDDVVRQAGVDPASKKPNVAGVPFNNVNVCAWRAHDFYLDVYATAGEMADVTSKPNYIDFNEVTVGDRHGVRFANSDFEDQSCGIAFETTQGLVLVTTLVDHPDMTPPCQLVEKSAGILSPALPR